MKKYLLLAISFFFYFVSFAQPANDDPAGAVSLSITPAYYAGAVNGTTVGATRSTVATNPGFIYDDVWYKFEVTGTSDNNISIALRNVVFTPSVPNYLQMNLWNGSLSTRYSGTANGIYNQFSLGIGTWYIQVWTDGNSSAERARFDIGIKSISAANPTNNECASAIALTSAVNTCTSPLLTNNIDATTSTPPLGVSAANNDVWYKFTAASTRHTINLTDINWAPGLGYPNITGAATANVNIEIGQGGCAGYVAMANSGNATSLETPSLTIGQEYFIRVSTVLSSYTRFADYKLCITHFVPPANDNIGGAISITPATGNCFTVGGTFTGSTNGATQSSQPTCASGSDNRDVWYNFTASSNYLRVLFDAIVVQTPTLELWNTDATTRIICENNTYLETAVTNGVNYKLRVIGYTGTYINSFTLSLLCSVTPPSNDKCNTPTNLPINTSLDVVALSGQTTAGASQQAGTFGFSCAGTNEGGDVWYSFTATKSSTTIALSNVVTTGSNAMSLTLFTQGCMSSVELETACGNTLTASTVPGNTYLLRVMKTNGCETVTFNLKTSGPLSPINDECSGAIVLPIQNYSLCSSPIVSSIRSTNLNATQSANPLGGSCAVTNLSDVWYVVNTPGGVSSSVFLAIKEKEYFPSSGFTGLKYVVYSSPTLNCGSLTYESCGDISSFSSNTPLALNTALYHYIRIYSADQSVQVSYKISVVGLPQTPTNITCASAQALTPFTTIISGTTANGLTLNTPADEGDCAGGTTGSRGVWYSFVANASSHLLNLGCIAPLGDGTVMGQAKVFSGTCGSLTQMACFESITMEGGLISGLTPGQTYYILVTDFSVNSVPYAFQISIRPTSVFNDEAATAHQLYQDLICTAYEYSSSLSTLTASPVLPAHPTGLTYAADVWFKFTAAHPTATIAVADNAYNYLVKVYNNALTTTLSFDGGADGTISPSGGNVVLTGLTVGQNYYIRMVLSYNPTFPPFTAPAEGTGRKFKLCVYGGPAPVLANNATATSSCRTADGPVTSTNSNVWKHLTDEGKIIASFFDAPGNAGMGIINAYYHTHTTGVRTVSGLSYLDRNYEITPTVQPTNPVDVMLYFAKSELDSLIYASAGTSFPIRSLNDLRIHKLSGVNCNTFISFGGGFYAVERFGEVTPEIYFLQINVPSFSSFFIGPPEISILPIINESFTAQLMGNIVQLKWQAADLANIDRFEIERSFDGNRFVTIGNKLSQQGILQYQYQDNFNRQVTYYRIKSFTKDGRYHYSKVVVIKPVASADEMVVYPNPAKASTIQLSYVASKAGQATIQLMDNAGRRLQTINSFVTMGNQSIAIDISKLQAGTYYINLSLNGKMMTKKIVKH
jgi:hypothetical protein